MDAHRREAKLNRRVYEELARRFVDGEIANNKPCGQCGLLVDRDITLMSRIKDSGYFNHPLGGTLGHIIAVIHAPHLAHTQSNWRLEHRRCNSRDGQRIATTRRNAARKREVTQSEHSRDWG
jgi:hypothetical protein